MKKVILTLLLLIGTSAVGLTQEDEEGCKDHPLFNRLSNFYIENCVKNYNIVEFHTSAENTITKEGNVFRTTYNFKFDSGDNPPSPYQVIKNYENAILKNGGEKIYSSAGDDGYQGATFTLTTKDVEYWIKIDNMAPGHPDVCTGYELYIVEVKSMKQEIQANEILNALNKDGYIVLYINFESGKADIKPESQKIIDQIVKMLKDNPDIKISIEGHTDNVGTPESNQTLSENRARAVLNAIKAQGIEEIRLTSKGWGQTKPIADNRTEEGRAKNRRVEIVKQ